jgi:hypothetical protein
MRSGWAFKPPPSLSHDSRRELIGFVRALSRGTARKERLDSRPRHRLIGFAAQCGGLEGPRLSRTIGNANRLAVGLPGRAGGRLRRSVSSVAVWI